MIKAYLSVSRLEPWLYPDPLRCTAPPAGPYRCCHDANSIGELLNPVRLGDAAASRPPPQRSSTAWSHGTDRARDPAHGFRLNWNSRTVSPPSSGAVPPMTKKGAASLTRLVPSEIHLFTRRHLPWHSAKSMMQAVWRELASVGSHRLLHQPYGNAVVDAGYGSVWKAILRWGS
jgi:hypothetical protein